MKMRGDGEQRGRRDNELPPLRARRGILSPPRSPASHVRGGVGVVGAARFVVLAPKAGALYGFPEAELALP